MSEPLELTHEVNLVTAEAMGEITSAQDLATIRSSHRNISGHPDRVCRICHKKFPSGRALGGHMRVHGPLYTQGSASRLHGDFRLAAADGTQKLEEEKDGFEGEEQEPAWIVDEFEGRSDKELVADQYMGSEPANCSFTSCGGGAGDPRISRKNGFGDAGDLSMYGTETEKLLSLDCNTELTADGVVAMVSANSTENKNFLYKLRNNPKRSCRFAEQEFTLESQQALMDFPGKTSSICAGVAICSQCGKAFWSERALFGHMRCHPEREWRGVLPPESCSLERRAMARYRRNMKLAALKILENSESKIKNYDERREDKIAELDATTTTGIAENSLHITKEAAGKVRDMPDVDERAGEALQSKVGGMHLHDCLSFTVTSETNDVTPRRWLTAGRRSTRRVVSKAAGAVETSSDEAALTSESISLESLPIEQEPETPDCLILLAEAARKIEEAGTNLQNQHLQLISPAAKSEYDFSAEGLRREFDIQPVDEAFDAGEDKDDAGDYDDDDAPRFGRRERLHKDLVSSTWIGGKYECTTCKKTFNTHQALGGHRASHKKTKGCFARTGFYSEHLPVEEVQLACGQEKDPLHSIIHKKKKQKRGTPQSVFQGHACSICHRIFLTGQALGGHKRCHWAGDQKPSETASVASTEKQPSLQSEEQSSKVVEGGIDLNMPAPVDEEDEIGYGSAEQHLTGYKSTQAEEVKDAVGTYRMSESSERKGNSPSAWTFIDDATSSILHAATRESEARNSRLNGTWGQHWPEKKGDISCSANYNTPTSLCHAVPCVISKQ